MLKRTHGRRLDPTNTFAEVEVIHPDGRKEWMPDTQVDEINRRAAAPKPTLPGSVEDRLSALERRVKALESAETAPEAVEAEPAKPPKSKKGH